MLPLDPPPARTGLNPALLLLREDQEAVTALSVLWHWWPAAQTASPLLACTASEQPTALLEFETFEHSLCKGEHNSHMNDALALSVELNSWSFNTVAGMYVWALWWISWVISQEEFEFSSIHWASLSVLLMPVENYSFHLKITLFINTLTLALSILHATVLYFKYNVNISKCWPSHLYLCSFWTLGRGAGMWGEKKNRLNVRKYFGWCSWVSPSTCAGTKVLSAHFEEGSCSSRPCVYLTRCAQGAFDIGGGEWRTEQKPHVPEENTLWFLWTLILEGAVHLLFLQYCYLNSGRITHLSQNRSCTHKLVQKKKLILAAQIMTYFEKCTSRGTLKSCMLHTSPH